MTNLFVISLPFIIAFDLALGALVLATHSRRLANRIFAVLSLVIAVWLSCQFFGFTTTSEVWLRFWIRQACASSLFMPLLFHALRGALAQPAATFSGLLRQSALWVCATIAVAAMCQSDFFVFGAKLPAAPQVIAEPMYGAGFAVFISFWVAAVFWVIWSLWRSLIQAVGGTRLELQIVALGSFLALVPGVVLLLLVPAVTGSSQSALYAPITVVIWHGVMAYGIVTRHIMGIGEFLRRVVVYLLLACFLCAVYLLVFKGVSFLSPYSGQMQESVAHVLAAVVMAVLLAPTRTFLIWGADRLFERRRSDLAGLLDESGELARSVTTADDLALKFSRLLCESLGTAFVCVFLRGVGGYTLRAKVGAASVPDAISEEDPLLEALLRERRPLLRDVVRRRGPGPGTLADAERALTRVQAEAAVALKSNNGLAGLLLLGRRHKSAVYGRREEDALILIGDQMGMAIENTSLYTKLDDARVYNEVLLESLVTGVVAADRAGRVTVCNREALRILRLETASGAVVGRSAVNVLPAAVWGVVQDSLTTGRCVRDRSFVLGTGLGDGHPVRVSTALFGDQGSAASGVLVVLQDISAIRKLEDQVRRSDRLASIGTLAAGMAHEIKNPLVCLKTFAQLLPSRYDDADFRETFTPLLANEVERINVIVSQLLNFSRPVKPTLVPLSLHAALDESWQLAAQKIESKGIEFVRRYQASRDCLLGDRRLLGQVFLNLFLNGADAMEGGGRLTVSTHVIDPPDPQWPSEMPVGDAWIEVRVQDSGRGVSPEDRQRIFDPFFTTKDSGTGLGLSVAHGIVLEHGGLIDLESTPKVGSCFRVLLPLLTDAGCEGVPGKGVA